MEEHSKCLVERPRKEPDADDERDRQHGRRYPLFPSWPGDATKFRHDSAKEVAAPKRGRPPIRGCGAPAHRTLLLFAHTITTFTTFFGNVPWQGGQDLNPQPVALEATALPIELPPYNPKRLRRSWTPLMKQHYAASRLRAPTAWVPRIRSVSPSISSRDENGGNGRSGNTCSTRADLSSSACSFACGSSGACTPCRRGRPSLGFPSLPFSTAPSQDMKNGPQVRPAPYATMPPSSVQDNVPVMPAALRRTGSALLSRSSRQNRRTLAFLVLVPWIHAPGRNRTASLGLRSPLLYPV